MRAEQRAGVLLDAGQRAITAGNPAAAVDPLVEAAGLARELTARRPRDPKYRLGLGSVLYSLGEALIDTGGAADAVLVLTEALDAYSSEPGLAADARLRRGRAYAALNAGASAVADVQAAVVARVRRADVNRVDEAYLGLTRTLLVGTPVLAGWGDPDVGLAAAQIGMSWLVQSAGDGPLRVDAALLPAVRAALSVERSVLRGTGRAAEAAASTEPTLAHLGLTPVPTQVDLRRDRDLVPSLHTPSVRDAVALLVRRDRGRTLRRLLLDDPVGPLCAPVFRTPPPLLYRAASEALFGARQLLYEKKVGAGVRLGLEAHWLFAQAHQDGLLAEPGVSTALWAQLLGELSLQSGFDRDLALAADLAGWSRGVLALAEPHPEIAPHARAAVEHACRLYPPSVPPPLA